MMHGDVNPQPYEVLFTHHTTVIRYGSMEQDGGLAESEQIDYLDNTLTCLQLHRNKSRVQKQVEYTNRIANHTAG